MAGFDPHLPSRIPRALLKGRIFLHEILHRRTIIGRLGLRVGLVCTSRMPEVITGAVHSEGEVGITLVVVVVGMVATRTVMGAVAVIKIARILSGILIRILVVEISTRGIRGPDRGVL